MEASDEVIMLSFFSGRLLTNKFFHSLKHFISGKGSAIVTIGGDLGAHVIVVDEMTSDQVRLHDPYHGWDIIVTLDAFKERFAGMSAIRVKPAVVSQSFSDL
ncbi:MAG: hypothetical protein ACE5GN_01555 [Waddliaceae bacterium]